MRTLLLLAAACLSILPASSIIAAEPTASAEAQAPQFDRRWLYVAKNLQVEANVSEVLSLIERAASSGYNGILLADYKLNVLERVPAFYFKNLARVKAAADAAKIELIPAVFPIGYSSGILAHDPNLAEGLLAKDTPFVVRGREAKPAPADSGGKIGVIANGEMEEARGDRFLGYSFQDAIGKASFVDRQVKHGGKASLRIEEVAKHSESGNCRISQRIKVRPHACYRLSAWVKTEDLAPVGGFRLLALSASAGGRPLSFYESDLKATADWQQIDVIFNSLGETEVNVYAGQWGGRSGKLWIDDFRIEEIGLLNVLRREGCPLTVTSEDGMVVYEEGRDFHPIKDEKLGMVPYAGEYSFKHAAPSIRLTDKSRIKDGQRLAVSWYHPVFTHDTQVMCCFTHPKVYEIMRDQVKRVNDALKPKTFFMSHDEIRVANWCESCQKTGHTPGKLLADNVKRCIQIVKEANPDAQLVVWSDMFDPHHNARDKYYLANGTFADSWLGLPKEVIIANWNSGKAAKSIKFFADRGHRQIAAGYYDHDKRDSVAEWTAATKAAGLSSLHGFMYTTWANKYKQVEEYGRRMNAPEPQDK